jgi:hypothetical protein
MIVDLLPQRERRRAEKVDQAVLGRAFHGEPSTTESLTQSALRSLMEQANNSVTSTPFSVSVIQQAGRI